MVEEQENSIQIRTRKRQSLVRGVGQQLAAHGDGTGTEGAASRVVDFLLPSGLDATFENWLGRAKRVWEEELRWLDRWEQVEQRERRRPPTAASAPLVDDIVMRLLCCFRRKPLMVGLMILFCFRRKPLMLDVVRRAVLESLRVVISWSRFSPYFPKSSAKLPVKVT